MNADMLTGQSLPLSITAKDGLGNTVPLPAGSTVTYTSDNPGCFTVTENADGVTAVGHALKATGPVNGTVSVSATLAFTDASGVHSFTSTIPLTVTITPAPGVITSVSIVSGVAF